jgi:peptidoglycan/LPS O-acetylase OafA/YrhL
VLASLFYQHGLVFGQMSSLNPVAWSLEVEIQFYLLAPLVMQFYRIGRKGLRRAMLLCAILAVGLAQLPFQSQPRFGMSILFYGQYFLMGLLVADVFVLDLEKMSSSWWWDLAGAAALVTLFWMPDGPFWHGMMPVPIAVLCIAAMRSHALRRVFANPWIATIGGMCYSIYLLHFLLIAVLFKLTRRAILPGALFFVNYAIQLLLVTVPVLILCALFFLLVERPCMDPNWPSKLWQFLTGHPESDVAVLDAGGVSE